jgi:hypothetical protein
VETLCKDSVLDSTKVSQELSEFIGNDEVLEYYILSGPFPIFPDTMFEIVMLSKKCLYDFEIKEQGALRHVLPLSQIIQISEEFGGEEAEKYITVHFRVSALGTGLVFQSKLKDIRNIREVSNAVRRRIAETA